MNSVCQKRSFGNVVIFILALVFLSATFSTSALAEDSLQIYLQRGGRLMLNDDYAKALENFQSALRLDPDNFEALKSLGLAHLTLGHKEQAQGYLERAYQIDPFEPGLCNNLGALLSSEGNSTEAIKYFEAAANLDSNKAVYLTNLGQEYVKIGRISKALPALHRARELEPDKPVILFSLGNCYAAANSLDSAEFYFERSVATGGKTAQLFYFLGTIKRRLGKIDEAEQNFKQALTYNTKYKDCLQSLGMLYIDQQRYAETAEQARRVVEIDSISYAGWILLGAAYALDGMTAQADSILQRLFAVDSSIGFQMLDFIGNEQKKRQASPQE
jgi:tetratricopeptide (TPR) repeat protein